MCNATSLLLNWSCGSTKHTDLCLYQGAGKLVFGKFPLIFELYTINEAHKQYNLLDTTFKYILYSSPPQNHLYISPPNPLHVGWRSPPTCSGFSYTLWMCSWNPKSKLSLNMVSNRQSTPARDPKQFFCNQLAEAWERNQWWRIMEEESLGEHHTEEVIEEESLGEES